MKAIVLSAGQGRRLLPLTAKRPKCLLPIRETRQCRGGAGAEPETVLGVQLHTLARCGIARALVIVGFGAARVESYLERHATPGLVVETLYNPFYGTSDNLVSCWLARREMHEDFLLLNGDTLFEDAVLHGLLDSAFAPVTIVTDHKPEYDDDDMKVSLDSCGRLLAVGKTLPPAMVSGESIGLLAFRGSGGKSFADALEAAIRRPESLRRWYLSAVDALAQDTAVETVSACGLWWREIDSPEDLECVRSELGSRRP